MCCMTTHVCSVCVCVCVCVCVSCHVIVIARGQGFMAVNEPSPRAEPEDKVCLRCHKSLATRAITVI